MVDVDMDIQQYRTALAAGERAETRWLHESGLWTPTRGWAVEWLASNDREKARTWVRDIFDEEMTYGIDPGQTTDYETSHNRADKALDAVWEAIRAVADALVSCRRLTGTQIAEIAASHSGREAG